MTRKVSLTAALVTLVLMPWVFAIDAGASQAAMDQSNPTATAAPVAQRNESGASTKSVDAYVRLFEKGDTAGDVVCTLPITTAPYSKSGTLKKEGCSNDEAVSISFSNIPAGSTISLYDDPNCSTGEDWVKFTFLSEASWAYAHDFEINQEKKQDGQVVFTQAFHKKNGLNGKVSCIDIHVPEPH